MKILNCRVSATVSWLVLICFTAFYGAAPALSQQDDIPNQAGSSSRALPDAPRPMATPAATASEIPANSEIASAAGAQAQTADRGGTPQTSSSNQQQQSPQKPIGTAAAPPESTAGVTASRPAGAVIAPAKQRRARSILIRVGLLVGAGVALGTVIALTHATPSQPPQ